ncbi:MAG: hypothetical protein Q7T74_00335 [Candidatus Saccharibacteria bacterium]|nr:hypothetical protein [Candidatus Saccharibacteria bacterium]
MSGRGELWTPPIERVPTPVNKNGLVKKAALEKLVKKEFDTQYPESPEKWFSYQTQHHLNWPKVSYASGSVSDLTEIQKLRRDFRALELNKLSIGRLPHDILHEMTLPPDMPDDDVMYFIREYAHLGSVAFRSAMWVIKLDRQLRRLRGELPSQGENGTAKSRQRAIGRNLHKYYESVEGLANIPEELHIVKIDPNKSLRVVARSLGPLVLKPQLALAL